MLYISLNWKNKKYELMKKKNDEEEKNDNDWMRLGMFWRIMQIEEGVITLFCLIFANDMIRSRLDPLPVPRQIQDLRDF